MMLRVALVRIHARCFLSLMAVCLFATICKADITPYTGAEVARNIAVFRLETTGVRLELEMHPDDVSGFLSSPFSARETFAASLEGGDARARLSDKGISVALVDGTQLPAHVLKVEHRTRVDRASPFAGMIDPISGAVIPAPPETSDVLFVEAFFSFVGTQPNALVLRPPKQQASGELSLGFFLFDRSVPVTRFSFLARDARVDIDWQDPWHSRFVNVNLNRTAQDGTTSFVYVFPQEIRHEVLIRARELAPWIGETLTNASLSQADQARIRKAAVEFLQARNPLTIAGEIHVAASSHSAFLELGETGFTIVEKPKPIATDTAFLGAILSYPVPGLPPEVAVTWDMFDQAIKKVPTTLTDPAGPFLTWATPDAPKIIWTNYLKQNVDPKVKTVPAFGVVSVSVYMLAALAVSLVAALSAARVQRRGVTIAMAAVCAASLFMAFQTRDAGQWSVISPAEPLSLAGIEETVLPALLAGLYTASLEVIPQARSQAMTPVVAPQSLDDIAAELENNLAIRVAGGARARVSDVQDIGFDAKTMHRLGGYRRNSTMDRRSQSESLGA